MLTDIDSVYVDFKKPTQKRLGLVDASALSVKEENLILEQLPVGSMRPKFEAALQFARAAGGSAWSAIGRMEDLPEILDGTKG
jgi:carbamate kinase